MNRPVRRCQIDDETWTLVDAWRSGSGLGLGYFVAPDRGNDRRTALEADADVTSLSEEEVRDLWESAASLTPTERRFRADDGELWLAQSVGPVWGEGAAAGTTGLRLTCLTAGWPVRELPDVRLDDMDDASLAARAAGEG